ncbi:hypothetical protein JCM11641_003312 [Rhodosporidiobolus odoratus]
MLARQSAHALRAAARPAAVVIPSRSVTATACPRGCGMTSAWPEAINAHAKKPKACPRHPDNLAAAINDDDDDGAASPPPPKKRKRQC